MFRIEKHEHKKIYKNNKKKLKENVSVTENTPLQTFLNRNVSAYKHNIKQIFRTGGVHTTTCLNVKKHYYGKNGNLKRTLKAPVKWSYYPFMYT